MSIDVHLNVLETALVVTAILLALTGMSLLRAAARGDWPCDLRDEE